MNNSDETILSEETLLRKNSHTLHELIKGFGDNATDNAKIIKEKFKKIALKYHPDKNEDHLKVVFQEKFNALNEFRNKIKAGGYKAETIKNLITNYPNQDNPSSPNPFETQRKRPAQTKPPAPENRTEENTIKPEDKQFFESFKKKYYENSTAVLSDNRFDEKELKKCFISFRNREYNRFTKSKNHQSGAIEFKHISRFNKTTYESYIFFPDQPNPETPSHDRVILKSYKQAVSENNIAKPDDLTQNIKKENSVDEYDLLQLKKDFVANYIEFNISGNIINNSYILDRFSERLNLYRKTGNIKPIEKFTIAENDVADTAFNTLLDKPEAKAFLEKLRVEYLKQQEIENKKREERENKEREEKESIQARWSEFCENILKSKEDASKSVASYCDTHLKKLGDYTANLPIELDSSWSSFRTLTAEEWGKTLTNLASLSQTKLTFPELPQIHFSWKIPDNSETDEPDSNSKKRPREEADKEPKEDQGAKKRARTEGREEAEKGLREAEKRAREATKRASEAAEKARQEIERVASQRGKENNNSSSSSNKSPTSQPPRPDVAFFGTKAKKHKQAPTSNRRNSSSGTRKPGNTTSARGANTPQNGLNKSRLR